MKLKLSLGKKKRFSKDFLAHKKIENPYQTNNNNNKFSKAGDLFKKRIHLCLKTYFLYSRLATIQFSVYNKT
jgi:hypothetical protein